MITAERLREILSYEPTTGLFRWLVRTSNRIRVGDVAGSDHKDGTRKINLEGRTYLHHRLAHLAMTGNWPENDVTRKNHNRSDNRWINIRAA